MEQQIRFCTTSDGVRIAYTVLGEGPPIVRALGWFTHLEYEWKSQYWRSFMEVSASQYLQIHYDGRGMGLSDRNVSDFSLEAHVRDLEAVIDAVGIERFGLSGISQGGPTAITYAVRHPERVAYLVLYGSYARLKPAGLDLDTPEGRAQFDAMVTLMRHGWGSDSPAFRQMFTGLFMPEGDAEGVREFNEMQRASTSAETAATLFSAMMEVDVTDILTKVSVPTLVIHRKGDGIVPFELGRQLATAIPGARFLPLEGNNHAILPNEPELLTMAMEIDNFTREVLENEEKRRQSAGMRLETRGSSEQDLVGATIARYMVLEKLGEGGMGVVYKAEDTKLKRQVALKFLPSELTQSHEWKQRFLREAQAAAALAHPNICTIHEIDETGDQAFIAMECIDGKSLTEKIQAGPLDREEAVNIALRVAEGLKHAHKRGIVHRDIKPANIMVSADGQVKITDFGLAKFAGKTRLTKTATIMGTVAYMSPEQARGDSAIDHRTDIWSLGVLLYEMLSGALPFEAETDTGLIYKIINEVPEPISRHRSDIPASLASIVEKAIQKDPQSRYQNAEELISDLETVKSGAPSMQQSPSIAVLPFVNMSADPEQEYFCDGLSEELINGLTQIKDLKVIARTSAFSFKGEKADVQEIGRKLKVRTVLEGSVRKSGNRVRITAQLVDTTHGHHIWSERYDRNLDDIFAIQDEITLAIIDKLKPRLLAKEKPELRRRQAVDIEAYNLCLRGRWLLDKRTADSLQKAKESFEQAIGKDPNCALAYAGLSEYYNLITLFGPVSPKETHPKSKAAALKALEIDDTLAEGYTSLARCKTFGDWDWQGAERDFKRAIELNPGSAISYHHYAILLASTLRYNEAIEKIERAAELDPFSFSTSMTAGMIWYYAGKYDEAIREWKRAIDLEPGIGTPHFYLGVVFSRLGDYEEARKEFDLLEKWYQYSGEPVGILARGLSKTLMGKRDETLKALEDLRERALQTYVPPFAFAFIYLALNENDQVFEWLNKAYEERDSWMTFIKATPALDPVRSDPRYKALLRKMNLEP